jgi:putative sugar O-methyltransferase
MTPLTAAVLTDIDRLAAAQHPEDDSDSTFWQGLGQVHRDKIATLGFETFKRHINFQYGSWQITKFTSRFTLRCLYALLRRGIVPTVAQVDWRHAKPTPTWTDAVTDNKTEAQRLRAYALYCGLIWQYASVRDQLGSLNVAEPTLGSPMPVWLHGRLISQDLAMAALDLNRIASVVALDTVRRVLEIGAGYGRLAYLFGSLFPEVEYTIADISPALAVAQNYLPAVMNGKNFRFMLPNQLDTLPDHEFDLIINVSSFDEMPSLVQNRYLRRIARLGRGHLYLAGHHHLKDRIGLEKLAYPQDWTSLFDRSHDVFPLWVEKLFAIG